MAVIYVDHTNKYELSTIGLQGAANTKGFMDSLRSFLVPVESAINEGVNLIGSWINTIIQSGNARRRDEQGYMLAADNASYNQENNMLTIIIIVVFVVALIYLGGKKKK